MLYLADVDLPNNVKGIIADCGFTSPKEILSCVFRTVTHLPPALSLGVTCLFTRIFAGFSLDEKDTRQILKNNKYPILMVHGTGDDFVPCDMSREMYEACTSPKRLVTIPEAGHGMVYVVDNERYFQEVVEFFSENGVPTTLVHKPV